MKLRKMGMALGASATAVVVSLALSTPAFASDYHMYTDDANPGGRVDFTAYNDVVKLCDTQADGYGVYIQVNDRTTGAYQYSEFASGNGNCVTHTASEGGQYNLTEGHDIDFYICLYENSSWTWCDDAVWYNG